MSTAEKKADVVQAPSDGATNTSEAGRGTDKENREAGRGADKESKGQNYECQHSDSANRGGQVSCVLSAFDGFLINKTKLQCYIPIRITAELCKQVTYGTFHEILTLVDLCL